MRAVCSAGRDFRKVAFIRLTWHTRPLPVWVNATQRADEDVPAGLEDLLWLLGERKEERWLLGNSTDPMPTEPGERGQHDEEIGPLGTRLCDCGLAQGEECCCPMR